MDVAYEEFYALAGSAQGASVLKMRATGSEIVG
jgi:hypothetical protein